MTHAVRLALLAVLVAGPATAQPPSRILESPSPRTPGKFGQEVAGLPDVDGDGFGDLVVGAMWEAGLAGRVHVFSGATGTLLYTLASPTPRTDFGTFGLSVSGVPDVDGDGRWDVLVGTSSEGSSATGFGRVHLFSGATGALLRTLGSPNPEGGGQVFPSFGGRVAGVADVDGDGRGDLLVGAYREDTDDAGRAYLFNGATGAVLHTFTSPNPFRDGGFGAGVSGVPDVDGDGVPDLLVGAPFEAGGASKAGHAYLFSGATGALLRTFASPNASANGFFGRPVVGVADLDGDGRGDLVVGAGAEDAPLRSSGRAYVFSGATGALLHTLASPNAEATGRFGDSASGVPDVDGDGVDDLLVGAMNEDGGALNAGRAYLYSGATGALLRTLQSPSPQGVTGFDGFGFGVAGVPDTDGDGRGDLLVGVPKEDGGLPKAGRAYLFSGAAAVSAESAAETDGLALTAWPNPARGTVRLTLTLDRPEAATVSVADALGREVARLHDGPLAAGKHALDVGTSRWPAGVYVVRVTSGTETVARRLTVVR